MPTVVITAHGRLDRSSAPIVLPVNFYTVCKFGETHSGTHLGFENLSIFSNPKLLYRHILNEGSYTTRGEMVPQGGQIPHNIVLTPFTVSDPTKAFSWQKQYVEMHLTKTLKCIGLQS